MTESWKYPTEIQDRVHVRFTAYEYSMPSLPSREQSGDVYSGVILEREKTLFNFSTYLEGGFGDSMSAEWRSNNKIAFKGDTKKMTEGRKPADFASEGARTIMSAAAGFMTGYVDDNQKMAKLKAAGESATGLRVAPNEAMTFLGNSSRDLSFSIKFSPIDKEEGKTMKEVIAAFRNATTASRPQQIEGMLNVMVYPPIFDISIIDPSRGGGAVSSNNFIQFRSMVLEKFDVKYSEGNDLYTWFTDGTPTSATLSISFKSMFPAFRTTPGSIKAASPSSAEKGDNA